MAVRGPRRHMTGGRRAADPTSADIALHDVPAVVAATDHVVDLFPGSLADVAGQNVAGSRIEAESPCVAEAVCEYLVSVAARAIGERVARRNSVCRLSSDIETQDLAVEGHQVLG